MNYKDRDFLKRKPKFEAWLTERGAQVLEATNEWEVCRFLTDEGTSIIYRKKGGTLTFVGGAMEAYSHYLQGLSWRGAPASKRKTKLSPILRTIRERDGDECFFCRQPVNEEDESKEHLIAITHGGPDHIANIVLAHKHCNLEAGHLSVMEKIQLREKNTAVKDTPPWEEA